MNCDKNNVRIKSMNVKCAKYTHASIQVYRKLYTSLTRKGKVTVWRTRRGKESEWRPNLGGISSIASIERNHSSISVKWKQWPSIGVSARKKVHAICFHTISINYMLSSALNSRGRSDSRCRGVKKSKKRDRKFLSGREFWFCSPSSSVHPGAYRLIDIQSNDHVKITGSIYKIHIII